MRPKKRILLAGNYEFRVGVLSFLLRTHGYAVTTADTADEAEQLMLHTPACAASADRKSTRLNSSH